MANKNLDVGIKYTGDAKGFKKANDEARREAAKLRKEAVENSREMERKFKGAAMTIAKLGAAFMVAQQAAKLYAAAMNTTEGSSDKLAEQMGLLQGAVQGAFTTLFSGDWLSLIDNIKRTAAATRDQAKAEDELNEAKARNQVARGDLEIELQATKVAAAEETDPSRKRSLLQEAVSIQQQITDLNVAEIQKRIDAEEQYYKTLFNASDKYWEFVKSNLIGIIKNYDVYFSQTEANAKRLNDLNYQLSLGDLTPSQAKEREGLMMLQALMSDYTRLQDELSKKGQWEVFLGMLGEVRQAAADGDAAILRLTKQITTLGITLDKAGEKKDVIAPSITSKMPDVKWLEPDVDETNQSYAEIKANLEEIDAMTKQMGIELDNYNAKLEFQRDVSMQITGLFEDMFSSGIKGWEEFGKAALDAIKSIIVKLAALAATYLVLSMIPGFAEFLSLMGGFKGFMTQGMGLGTVPVKAGGGGMAVLKGRDIVYSSARSSNSLGGLT